VDPYNYDPQLSSQTGDYPLTVPPEDDTPRTHLADYLDALRAGQSPDPTNLVLPAQMLRTFDELYRGTEREALETGCALLYDPTTRSFTYGATTKGLKNSCNPLVMPLIGDPNCFGYVHAHPSKAMGYDGAYCPPSVEDLLCFEYLADRPYFFIVVASGPMVYVMIYINGVSRLGRRHEARRRQAARRPADRHHWGSWSDTSASRRSWTRPRTARISRTRRSWAWSSGTWHAACPGSGGSSPTSARASASAATVPARWLPRPTPASHVIPAATIASASRPAGT
jgi:hypothetical protein